MTAREQQTISDSAIDQARADIVEVVGRYLELKKEGVETFWEAIEKYRNALTPTGEFEEKRRRQSLDWMWQLIDSGLRQYFRHHAGVKKNLPQLSQAVAQGHTTPAAAAQRLLGYLNPES